MIVQDSSYHLLWVARDPLISILVHSPGTAETTFSAKMAAETGEAGGTFTSAAWDAPAASADRDIACAKICYHAIVESYES